MLNKAQEQKGFLENIVFADEARDLTFRTAHRRRLHTWCYENPYERAEYVTGSLKVNVWPGALGELVTGPQFFIVSLDLHHHSVVPPGGNIIFSQ